MTAPTYSSDLKIGNRQFSELISLAIGQERLYLPLFCADVLKHRRSWNLEFLDAIPHYGLRRSAAEALHAGMTMHVKKG